MRITKKVLSLLLAFVMLASVSAPAMAYNSEGSEATDADSETPIGQDTLQGHQSEYEKYENADSATTEVYATKESTFKVLIPKTIILSGDGEHIGQYVLQVQGDMEDEDTISITPQETEIMLNNVNGNKDPIPATVTQDKDTITGADVGENWTTLANGSIAAPGLKAGSWKGAVSFNISIDRESDYVPFEITKTNRAMIGYTDETTDLVIPATFYDNETDTWYKVTSIGGTAFLNCTNLESVTIPEGVTSIGNGAFYGCDSLTSVTIPDSVTSIGGTAFYKCNFESVTIPEGVTSIGKSAFSDCKSLTSVTIPNSVTFIEDGAFSNCKSFTSVTIPNSVTSIGGGAFSGCKSLTSVTIPDSVTSIGSNAFAWCDSLESVTIPNSVTSIGNCAFYDVPHIIYNGPYEEGKPWGAKSIN